MIKSLLVKLGMLAVTVGIVLWMGWMRHVAVESSDAFTQEQTARGVNGSGQHALDQSRVVSVKVGRLHNGALLDLNRATADELEALPGIGAVLAQRVVAFRESAGRFRTVDDLRGVKGIGAKKFDRLKSLITVSTSETQRETERRAS
ncbi:MAG: ComEA family DNA-binding protein [Nitrospira sp.]|nr:ComEA family DNA-binding protein [Nitrospira sp.]